MLATEFGIGVRNGCFCAHPYLAHLLGLTQGELAQVAACMAAGDRSAIPGMVRVSFGAYNTREEVDTLADALERIAGGGYRGDYVQDPASGEYAALGWSPPDVPFFSARPDRTAAQGTAQGVPRSVVAAVMSAVRRRRA